MNSGWRGGCRLRPGRARPGSRPCAVDRGAGGLQIVERHDGEAGQERGEAVAQLDLVGRADRAQRAAVKGVREGDQDVLLGPPVMVVIAPRRLDRPFHGFGARIGEKNGVGEGEIGKAPGVSLALRGAVQVGDVDQGRSLILDRPGEVRVAVPEQIDGDAAGEIQILLALLAEQINAFAAHRPDRRAGINGHKRRDGHDGLPDG
jgi:hypothetical protein